MILKELYYALIAISLHLAVYQRAGEESKREYKNKSAGLLLPWGLVSLWPSWPSSLGVPWSCLSLGFSSASSAAPEYAGAPSSSPLCAAHQRGRTSVCNHKDTKNGCFTFTGSTEFGMGQIYWHEISSLVLAVISCIHLYCRTNSNLLKIRCISDIHTPFPSTWNCFCSCM